MKAEFSIRKLLLGLAVLLTAFTTSFAQEIETTEEEDLPIFLYTQPQAFALGPNIGGEFAITQKMSITADITAQLWWTDFHSFALSSNLKFYTAGEVGDGFYLRAKFLGGTYLNQRLPGKYLFIGIGLGLGFMKAFTAKKQWYFFLDTGIKLAPPIGPERRSTKDYILIKPDFAQAIDRGLQHLIISPASLFDLSVGIAFRF